MFKKLLAAVVLAYSLAGTAHAALILSGAGAIESSDPTQTNRIFRDGIASTWGTPKTFPGTFLSGTWHYDVVGVSFVPNALQDIYYEISYTNLDGVTPHLTAYLNSFDPTNLASNYLGDTGSTAFIGGTETMQVVVSAGDTLLLHFSGVNTDFGRYEYSVNAFSDARRNESFVPEPASLALLGLGLASLAATRRRKP